MSNTKEAFSQGHYEPELYVTFLPKCPSCGEKHPLARTPKAPADQCPDCGTRLGTTNEVSVPAVLTGRTPEAIAARALFAAGKFIRSFTSKGK